ncbi:class F sortase [Phycicoccus jejuensis]|uniref:class F sortase n=1 Tax=Phycicoccus jejuensis TaxID=367299 RepID=UPI000A012EC2|nr:class F sortase [Phycicoccus jejuensis]
MCRNRRFRRLTHGARAPASGAGRRCCTIPQPGGRTPTPILAGHVGTPGNGPDVFRRLPQARRGDTVSVRYDSGDVVRFVVRRSAGMPKQQTPTDDTIWDAGNPEPLLRLITCDPRTPLARGHYEGNWVLWADLA